MINQEFIWGIFVARSEEGFPNFFPIGMYTTQKEAENMLWKLPKNNNYQLMKFPVNELFGYKNKEDVYVGMDGIQPYHFHYNDEEK